MNILLTGGTGFIGSQLLPKLLSQNHSVTVLTRDPDSARASLPAEVRLVRWSSHEEPPEIEPSESVDCVIHLAGETVTGRWNEKKRAKIRDTRIIGTQTLLTALKTLNTPPKNLICASAIGFYGDCDDEAVTEDSLAGDDFLADVCAGWERSSRDHADFISNVSQLRIGIVLGNGGGALSSMMTPFKMGVGGPMGSGAQWWSWIHMDDLLNMISYLVETPQSGPFNGTAPGSLRQREFAKVLAKTIKRPAFLPTPGFILKLALGGFSTELLSSKRVTPKRMKDLGFTFQWPELDGALHNLIHERGCETS